MLIRQTPASQGTETSAEVLVGPPKKSIRDTAMDTETLHEYK